MNIKRLIAGGAAAALILGATAVPALATGGPHWWHHDDDVNIGNWAVVKNYVTTTANTGYNISGGVGSDIDTGDAEAGALVINDVNSTEIGCGCVDGDIGIGNWAVVKNYVTTTANTGYNISGGVGSDIDTGDAEAGSVVTNFVNTTLVGI